MYVKLGVAIFFNIEKGKSKIYIVGEYLDRNIFHFHLSVNKK